MATVYFTNNADSGDGSLRAALATAASGDVVTYSDSAFADTDEIVILLSSELTPHPMKEITIDGRGKRIVLDGQSVTRLLRCASVDITLRRTYINIDFVNGYSDSYKAPVNITRATSTFKGCRILGGSSCVSNFVFNAGIYAEYSAICTMVDCLVSGCNRVGVNIGESEFNEVIIKRCTIIGNVIDISVNNASTANSITDCLIHTKTGPGSADIITTLPSTCGFVAPCPDVIDSSTWNNALWQSWDFRLTPESPYLTGAETASAENADLLGNPRQVGGALGAFEGSWLVVTSGEEKTLAADVRVDRLELHDCAALSFVGQDRRLSVVEGAVVGSATIHAPEGAYVALPDVASADAAIVIGATLCEYGAGLTAFGASASLATEVALAWTASDPDRGVLLERRVDGAWTTLAFVETGAAYTTSASPGRSYYRAYDGDVFLYADIWSALGVQFRVASTWVPAETATQNWEVLVQNVTTTERVMPGQGITLLARIYDAFDEDAALLNDGENVVSVKYACYFNSNGLFEEANEPVPGHVDVDAGCGCVLESVQTSDAWTLDDVGYNFVLTPDVRTAPLFEREGRYQIKVVVTLSEGNPVVFSHRITVGA